MRDVNEKQMSLFNEDKCYKDCDLCFKYYADNGECDEHFLLAREGQIESEINALQNSLSLSGTYERIDMQRKLIKLEKHLIDRRIV